MIISFSTSVTGINTSLSKKFAWTIIDLSTEILLDPVLNYAEKNTHTHTHTHTHTQMEKQGDVFADTLT